MSTSQRRLPNFLIIGAPKSGTTSLRRYLHHHPDVFIPSIAEPKYFVYLGARPSYSSPDNDSLIEGGRWLLDDYVDLFSDWRREKRGGEKSATYLWSAGSARAIRDLIPDVRLVAILRNPADRAFSHFSHNLRSLREPLTDFRDALDAETERKRGNWSYNYLYRERGRYAEQLERYYDLFPANQLLVLLYDDLLADASRVMGSICRHLGIAESYDLPVSERHNVSFGVPRNSYVHRLLTKESLAKSLIRRITPSRLQQEAWRLVFNRNIAPLPVFDKDLRRRLVEESADDVRRLERLIGRDLSAWLAT